MQYIRPDHIVALGCTYEERIIALECSWFASRLVCNGWLLHPTTKLDPDHFWAVGLIQLFFAYPFFEKRLVLMGCICRVEVRPQLPL